MKTYIFRGKCQGITITIQIDKSLKSVIRFEMSSSPIDTHGVGGSNPPPPKDKYLQRREIGNCINL